MTTLLNASINSREREDDVITIHHLTAPLVITPTHQPTMTRLQNSMAQERMIHRGHHPVYIKDQKYIFRCIAKCQIWGRLCEDGERYQGERYAAYGT